VYVDIDRKQALALADRHRNLSGRTGCGLCGAETIEQAVRHPHAVGASTQMHWSAIPTALSSLSAHQSINAATGAVHAAAWAAPDGSLRIVREDVGRHNALDKMIGAVLRTNGSFADGFALITSRASFEMVQKAATLGIALIAAISAPTGLAVRLAQETNVTLVGFARSGQYNVYAHAERIVDRPSR
jgi:FdhD protein